MSALPVQIRTRLIYEVPSRADGTRVLVDRRWPRGVSREQATLHAWLRDLAPSDNLQKWFRQHSESWPTFRKEYCKELRQPDAAKALSELYRFASQRKRLTLLFASKDQQHNHAVILRDLLEGIRKPPTGTGPAGLRFVSQAKRMTV